jgi:hypothetical protein
METGTKKSFGLNVLPASCRKVRSRKLRRTARNGKPQNAVVSAHCQLENFALSRCLKSCYARKSPIRRNWLILVIVGAVFGYLGGKKKKNSSLPNGSSIF